MQVLTAEETLKAIEKATAPLLRKIALLEKAVAQNSDRVSVAEAKRLTGIASPRTLKKHLTPVQVGENGRVYYSRTEILEFLDRKTLHKAA